MLSPKSENMGPDWRITSVDIDKTLDFVKKMESKTYVRKRIRDNISLPPPEITHDLIWEGMFDCLLSTRQKSGPDSPIAKFLTQIPFPLHYEICIKQENPERFISEQLGAQKGIQYYNKIARFAVSNLEWLENGGWDKIDSWILPLKKQREKSPETWHQKTERDASRNLSDFLWGIGPKQSRNYLQLLGLTRYEIPLDSRFVNWFSENEFPLLFDSVPISMVDRKLINQRLSVPYWYDGILDRLQELCLKCNILPVVLDACVFASFDPDWKAEKIPF